MFSFLKKGNKTKVSADFKNKLALLIAALNDRNFDLSDFYAELESSFGKSVILSPAEVIALYKAFSTELACFAQKGSCGISDKCLYIVLYQKNSNKPHLKLLGQCIYNNGFMESHFNIPPYSYTTELGIVKNDGSEYFQANFFCDFDNGSFDYFSNYTKKFSPSDLEKFILGWSPKLGQSSFTPQATLKKEDIGRFLDHIYQIYQNEYEPKDDEVYFYSYLLLPSNSELIPFLKNDERFELAFYGDGDIGLSIKELGRLHRCYDANEIYKSVQQFLSDNGISCELYFKWD